MDNDSKLTYIVISLLVVVLAFVAYFLQGVTDDSTSLTATSTKEQVIKKNNRQ